MEKPYVIYSPNSFSPDGDGINDFFKVRGQGIIDFQIEIFNRWGQMVLNPILLTINGTELIKIKIYQQVHIYTN